MHATQSSARHRATTATSTTATSTGATITGAPFTAALLALAATGLTACGGGSGAGDTIDLSPPAAFAYANDSVDMRSGVIAPPNATTYQGGAAAFTVVPELPEGLTLNGANGRIAGIPTGTSPRTTYTVTARNNGGSVSTEVELEVHATFDDATFVYALHPDANEISIWRVDATTDTLVPAGRVRTGQLPVRATTDPLGRFLYVVCGAQESVVVHKIDPDTGMLDAVQLATKDGAAFDVIVDPTGRFLYKSNLHVGTLQAFTIDPSSGKLAPTGAPVPVPGPSALEISQSGRNLFAGTLDGQAVLHFVVDEVTGLVQDMAGSAFVEGPVDLHFDDATNRLYALDFTAGDVLTYSVDELDGRPQLLFSTPTGGAPASITPVGDQLFVGMHTPGGVLAFDVDGTSGQPFLAESVALTGNATRIEAIGTDGDTLVALDNAALIARVGRDADDDLAWLDRRTALDVVTDVVVVHGPRAHGLATDGLLAATAQSLELGSYRATETGLEAAGLPLNIGLDPARIAVDADRGRAVVVARGSDQIGLFAIDETTLELSEELVFDAGLAPCDAAITKRGEHLVSLDADRLALWTLPLDGGTPELLDAEGVGSMPRHLAVDAADRFAFVATDEAVRTFAIDMNAGTLTDTGAGLSFSGGSTPAGLSISPDGRYLVVCLEGSTSIHVAEIDPTSGALTSRSTLVTGFRSTEPTFDARGDRLVTVEPDEDRVTLFAFDDDGTLALLSRADCGSDASAVAIDRDGQSVYGAALGSNTIEILAIDDATISPNGQVAVGPDTSPQVVAPLLSWSVLD